MRDGNRSTFNGQPYATGTVPMTIYTTSGTTSATGAITFTLPAGLFTTVYAAIPQVTRNTADPTLGAFAMVRSATTSQVQVQVFESKTSAVLLLGVSIEGLELATAAVTVSLTVIGI